MSSQKITDLEQNILMLDSEFQIFMLSKILGGILLADFSEAIIRKPTSTIPRIFDFLARNVIFFTGVSFVVDKFVVKGEIEKKRKIFRKELLELRRTQGDVPEFQNPMS